LKGSSTFFHSLVHVSWKMRGSSWNFFTRNVSLEKKFPLNLGIHPYPESWSGFGQRSCSWSVFVYLFIYLLSNTAWCKCVVLLNWWSALRVICAYARITFCLLMSLKHGDCLEVKREYYQNCSVLGCVTHCSQSAAHSCEQFLRVQQIGFVTLGPLHHA